MAYNYNYDQFRGRYNNMGYRPSFYERDNRPYYDLAPISFRQEPYYDNYRRDYRQGSTYDGRHGVVPLEEVFSRVEAPQWMDNRYHHGGQLGGYRMDRYDHHGGQLGGYRMDRYDHHGGQLGGYRLDRYEHHGGQDYGRGNFHHHQDDHGRHGNHHSSRTAVELYVPICCDKCERKLRKHLDYIEGVETITMDQTTKKVVVFGHVNPSHVLNRARHDKPEAEFWHSRLR